jgi:hypothetical protein
MKRQFIAGTRERSGLAARRARTAGAIADVLSIET